MFSNLNTDGGRPGGPLLPPYKLLVECAGVYGREVGRYRTDCLASSMTRELDWTPFGSS